MRAESGRVQSPPGSAQSPFAELASRGSMEGKVPVVNPEASSSSVTEVLGGMGASRPPRMPGSGGVAGPNPGETKSTEANGTNGTNGTNEDALDSPVSGLVDRTSPGVTVLHTSTTPSGILKEEGSVRDGMRRAVSWADFSHEDPARLTQVVEFERDGPSSPTSVDSWDGQDTAQCHCCLIQ